VQIVQDAKNSRAVPVLEAVAGGGDDQDHDGGRHRHTAEPMQAAESSAR
jgi:hypothetical protein